MLEEPTSLRIDDPGVRALFTESARFQSWLDVEAALALAQGELGIIPESAAREIVAKAYLKFLDLAAVREGLARTGHPLVPLVWELDRACAGDAGGYVHWGATTQDITDTATVLQIREALDLVDAELTAISAGLATLAKQHRDTPMIGRSNLQQAIPITFGYKMAGLLSAVERHRDRLSQLRERVLVGEFAGAAGTLASLETGAMETQAGLCAGWARPSR